MPFKPEDRSSSSSFGAYFQRAPHSISTDSTKHVPTLLFFGLLLVSIGVLATALPHSARANGMVGRGQKAAATTPQPQAPPSAAAYSDAPQHGWLDPDVTGGPDAGGYTFSDNRDAGGPVYDYRVPANSSRIADDQWVHQTGESNSDGLDDGVITYTLPFAFSYYGASYTSVHIGTNGNIHFGAPNAWYPRDNNCIPSSNEKVPQGMIAPLWFDFKVPPSPTSTAGVYVGTEGSGVNQTFVVQWRDVQSYNSASIRATFEVILRANGDITFQYKDLNGEGTYGSGGVIGIQNVTGTVGLPYAGCYHDALALERAIRYRIIQGVFLQPPVQAMGGAPGAMLTYTGTLINQTGASNSFTLTTFSNNWATVVTPTNTGTLANGDSVPVTASVQIPQDLQIGASDVATITASSALSSSGQFTATMTLSSSITTNGIDFSPVNPSRSGDYGSTVTYAMRLYNRTGQSNNFQLSRSSATWATTLIPYSTGMVSRNAYATVTIAVSVPAGATLGMQDVITVTASAQQPSPGSFFGAQIITTTAGVWRVQSDMLQPRSRSAAVSYGSNGQIYVLGGETANGATDLPVEQYDSLGNHWYRRGDLLQGVANAGAAAIGNAIYVPGGSTLFGVRNTLQVYYPDSDRAEIVQSDPLPDARFGAGVVDLAGKLYVIGGADASQVPRNTVFEYDPNRLAGSRWQQ